MKRFPRILRISALTTQGLLDIAALAAAFAAAYWLRFDFVLTPNTIRHLLTQLPIVVLIQFVALSLTGARSTIWRYTDLAHMRNFVYAGLTSFLVILAIRLTLPEPYRAGRVPLSVN